MQKPILVFKIGTASITDAKGFLDEAVIENVARQIALLHKDFHIVIVSSGAVGTGKKFIQNYSGKIEERKAAAAIGNPILINRYSQAFAPYGIAIAQSLCERHHFSNREQFLQLRDTYQELWSNNIIPIANENDVVSNRELKFSDNDELATLLAVGFGATHLLIGTSVPGVLDKEGKVVSCIEKIEESTLGLATQDKSSVGLGGMISKLTFARLATGLGTKVVIFGARETEGLLDAMAEKNGTVCLPQKASKNARQKWLASGSMVIGTIRVDEGAEKALLKRKSLLAVGVVSVEAPFKAGEVIEIIGSNVLPFAIAKVKISSEEIERRRAEQNVELCNADEIVLL